MSYRLILAAAAAGIAFLAVADANAADNYYPVRQRAQMDRLIQSVQPYNWTGFYVGLNGGHGTGQLRNDDPYGMGDIGMKGWSFGATAGYNWQFARRWVLGLETDFNWSNIGGSQSRDLCPGCGSFGYTYTETQDGKMPWFGTTRARLGFLPWQELMVYATGGVAYGKVKGSDTYAYSYTSPWYSYSGQSSTANSHFQVGWALGGGAEYAINRNWSAKVEYLHLDLGDSSSTYSCTGCTPQTISTRATDNIVRVGINYKF